MFSLLTNPAYSLWPITSTMAQVLNAACSVISFSLVSQGFIAHARWRIEEHCSSRKPFLQRNNKPRHEGKVVSASRDRTRSTAWLVGYEQLGRTWRSD